MIEFRHCDKHMIHTSIQTHSGHRRWDAYWSHGGPHRWSGREIWTQGSQVYSQVVWQRDMNSRIPGTLTGGLAERYELKDPRYTLPTKCFPWHHLFVKVKSVFVVVVSSLRRGWYKWVYKELNFILLSFLYLLFYPSLLPFVLDKCRVYQCEYCSSA